MSDHILKLSLDERWGATFSVSCNHDESSYLATDEDGEIMTPHECWVRTWTDNLSLDEYIAGEWPEQIAFPCNVRIDGGEDGVLMYYNEQEGASNE